MHKWKPGDRFRIRADWKHGGYPEDNGRKPGEHGTVVKIENMGAFTDLKVPPESVHPIARQSQWFAAFYEIEPIGPPRELHEDEGG